MEKVFETSIGWFFLDETGLDALGPFSSQLNAKVGLMMYHMYLKGLAVEELPPDVFHISWFSTQEFEKLPKEYFKCSRNGDQ